MRCHKLIVKFLLTAPCLLLMIAFCQAEVPDVARTTSDLQSNDPQVLFRALWTLNYPSAKSLSKTEKAKLSKLVIKISSSPSSKLKYAAIRALIQLDPTALPRLTPTLLDDKDPAIRAEILFALLHTEQYPTKNVSPQLNFALVHKSKLLRNAAIRYVEKIPSEHINLVNSLIKNYVLYGLSDSRPRTIIGHLRSRARPAILKAFAEANKHDKIAVADLATQIPIPDAKPFLEPLARGLKSEDPRQVRRTTGAVGRLGQSARSLTPLVLYVLQSAKRTDQKMLALTTLSKISSDDKATIKAIGNFLEDRSVAVQRSALNALSSYHQDARLVIDKIIAIAVRPTKSRDSSPRIARTLLKKLAPYSRDGLTTTLKMFDSASPTVQARLREFLPSFEGSESLDVYVEQFPSLKSRGRQACIISIAKHRHIFHVKLKSLLLLALKDPLPQVVEDALFLCARYPLVDDELKQAVLKLDDRSRGEIQLAKKLCQSAWANDPSNVAEALMIRIKNAKSVPDRFYNARIIEEMSKCRLYTTPLLKACQNSGDTELLISFCKLIKENKVQDKWISTALIKLLKHPEPDLRKKALEALGVANDDLACDAIIKHLLAHSEEEPFRLIANDSLYQIGRNALRRVTTFILKNQETPSMWALYRSLTNLASPAISCEDVILKGLGSPTQSIRFEAINLLHFEHNITEPILQRLV
ncbi:MAG: HEAT repeat domain-containing protein, partial [Planctomycetota bacterium]|nr:HEAT repeat domain-containing protein [Planctomycetota bacterium]